MISVGSAHHTCALLFDYSLKCWGWNNHGQLGLGDTDRAAARYLATARP